jgi:preprotein translocase subunit SecG
MSILVVLWILIAVALAIVYTYRRIVEGGSDELVHLSDATDMVLAKQEATARTIEQLDRVVMILAVVFVVYGVVLGAWQVYLAFK